MPTIDVRTRLSPRLRNEAASLSCVVPVSVAGKTVLVKRVAPSLGGAAHRLHGGPENKCVPRVRLVRGHRPAVTPAAPFDENYN